MSITSELIDLFIWSISSWISTSSIPDTTTDLFGELIILSIDKSMYLSISGVSEPFTSPFPDSLE